MTGTCCGHTRAGRTLEARAPVAGEHPQAVEVSARSRSKSDGAPHSERTIVAPFKPFRIWNSSVFGTAHRIEPFCRSLSNLSIAFPPRTEKACRSSPCPLALNRIRERAVQRKHRAPRQIGLCRLLSTCLGSWDSARWRSSDGVAVLCHQIRLFRRLTSASAHYESFSWDFMCAAATTPFARASASPPVACRRMHATGGDHSEPTPNMRVRSVGVRAGSPRLADE